MVVDYKVLNVGKGRNGSRCLVQMMHMLLGHSPCLIPTHHQPPPHDTIK
jgi:hypothetical protein